MTDNKVHPAWEVFDLQRTARLNVMYWTKMVTRRRRWNFWIEYALAVTAPSSAVAGFVFLDNGSWKELWKVLTILTAFLSIAKPLLKLSENIQTLQKVVLGYVMVESQLGDLSGDIRREDCYSPELVESFKRIRKQFQDVENQQPAEDVDEKLRKSCFDLVNIDLPAGSFHVPSR